MGSRPKLGSFGEIYPGFNRDRLRLRLWLGNRADRVWDRSFAKIRGTVDFYQCSDEAVARETMRTLLLLMP